MKVYESYLRLGICAVRSQLCQSNPAGTLFAEANAGCLTGPLVGVANQDIIMVRTNVPAGTFLII